MEQDKEKWWATPEGDPGLLNVSYIEKLAEAGTCTPEEFQALCYGAMCYLDHSLGKGT